MIPAVDILEDVSLAPHTTLELGGPARYFVRATDERSVRDASIWAQRRGLRIGILGGGSNLVISDEGFDGLVIEMAQRGIEQQDAVDRVRVTAAAGEDWDPLVARCVSAGLAGLECLGGIPGRVGATPIQNVGAYGQEVGETIESVRVLDRRSLSIETLDAAQCGFGYRDSYFKRHPERYVVLSVTFALTPEGPPAIRYAELSNALRETSEPTLSDVRQMVIALRRRKSMVLDFADDNHRSAGSFFTNPVVSLEHAAAVVERAVAEGLVEDAADVPRWPVRTLDGRDAVKLAAGWLVERAGMSKGTRLGNVGISTKHALALVHHGGGSTRELLELAERVRAAVQERFEVRLEMEPTLWA